MLRISFGKQLQHSQNKKVEISKCSHLFLEMVSVNRLYFLARDDPDIETDHSSMRFTGSV